jgi:integrase
MKDLADGLTAEYQANQRRSSERLHFSLKHLLPVFGDRRAVHLTSADIDKYKANRLAAGAAHATVNRELAALKRMFTLAVRGERIPRAPYIAMLQEDNVRQGFFERPQFDSVRAQLPDYLQPVVTFAYITGWRIPSEVLTLQWRQVDFDAGTVRLEPGTTKNRDGRMFVMTPELRECLQARRALTERFQREHDQIVPSYSITAGDRSGTSEVRGRRRPSTSGCTGAFRTISDVPPSATWSARACRVRPRWR